VSRPQTLVDSADQHKNSGSAPIRDPPHRYAARCGITNQESTLDLASHPDCSAPIEGSTPFTERSQSPSVGIHSGGVCPKSPFPSIMTIETDDKWGDAEPHELEITPLALHPIESMGYGRLHDFS
jgi:hypothetical protein